ncbi:MAG: glycoside hydrolase family 25 protein [Clostridiaceae bacterium]|nr:glycoside hydrolase family 25 protein [Clostridiaceae bacterium]
MRTRRGIDVSKWQGRIHWRRLQREKIQFAMIRIGFGSSDGECTRDSYFRQNMDHALEAEIDAGVYFYTNARTESSARREADWVIRELRPYYGKLSYPVALDIEDSSLESLSREENTNNVRTFCQAIREAGYYPMYYTYLSFLENFLRYDRLGEYDLWLAAYTSEAPHQYRYDMWQYSDRGRLDGIHGYTDLDHSFRNYPAIIRQSRDNEPVLAAGMEEITAHPVNGANHSHPENDALSHPAYRQSPYLN